MRDSESTVQRRIIFLVSGILSVSTGFSNKSRAAACQDRLLTEAHALRSAEQLGRRHRLGRVEAGKHQTFAYGWPTEIPSIADFALVSGHVASFRQPARPSPHPQPLPCRRCRLWRPQPRQARHPAQHLSQRDAAVAPVELRSLQVAPGFAPLPDKGNYPGRSMIRS
jgi:hypothetical protein